MGRPRKPTSELERRGAFDKDPARGRARKTEPIVLRELGGPPPEFLNDKSPTSIELLRCWNDVVAACAEVHLTAADTLHVEMTARLLYVCRRPGAKSGDRNTLNKHLSQLGLNPASRSLVNGIGVKTTEEEANEWEQAAAGSDGLPVQ